MYQNNTRKKTKNKTKPNYSNSNIIKQKIDKYAIMNRRMPSNAHKA